MVAGESATDTAVQPEAFYPCRQRNVGAESGVIVLSMRLSVFAGSLYSLQQNVYRECLINNFPWIWKVAVQGTDFRYNEIKVGITLIEFQIWEGISMAKCEICGREMTTADGCSVSKVFINGIAYERIKCGDRFWSFYGRRRTLPWLRRFSRALPSLGVRCRAMPGLPWAAHWLWMWHLSWGDGVDMNQQTYMTLVWMRLMPCWDSRAYLFLVF